MSTPTDATPSKLSLLAGKTLASCLDIMGDISTDMWYPRAAPILGRDATFEGDGSQPLRRYVSEIKTGTTVQVRFRQHACTSKPPPPLQPLQAAVETVSGTTLPTATIRQNGPTDVNSALVPVVATLASGFSASWNWDHVWPIYRTMHAMLSLSNDVLNFPEQLQWATCPVVAPHVTFSYVFVSSSDFGRYVAGTLTHPTVCEPYTFGKVPIVFSLGYTVDQIKTAYYCWTTGTLNFSRTRNPTNLYHASALTSTYGSSPSKVVVVCDFVDAAHNFSSPQATEAHIDADLSDNSADYLGYFNYLRASIVDDELFVRAALLAATGSRIAYVNSASLTRYLGLAHVVHINPPNPLTFFLRSQALTAGPRTLTQVAPPTRWYIPVARRLWFHVELLAVVHCLPVWTLTQAFGSARNRILERVRWAQEDLSESWAGLGMPFSPDMSRPVVYNNHFDVIMSPNKWFEEMGYTVTAYVAPKKFMPPIAPTAQRPYLMCQPTFAPERFWLAPTSYRPTTAGGTLAPLTLSVDAAYETWMAVPLTANGDADANAWGQLRPCHNIVGVVSVDPVGTVGTTAIYTASPADAYQTSALGSALAGYRIEGSDVALDLYPDSFLGGRQRL